MLRTLMTAVMTLAIPHFATAETVQIAGATGPLSAEMIRVDGAEHAVVIIPGSGPVDRDGNSPQTGLRTDTYKKLAEGLAAAGVSTLRVDKRGFFGSEAAAPDPEDVTIVDYASDALKWVDRAAEIARCVWIAGHSEGGLVALTAAREATANFCGLILISTSGRPIGALLKEQMRAYPANAPVMSDIDAVVADLEAGRTRDPTTLPAALRPMFSLGLQRYMIDLFSHDPVSIAGYWKGPALIVQGDADVQVKPLDADLLSKALPQAERVDLPGGTHMLKSQVPGLPFATYIDPQFPLHPALTPAIAAFLGRHSPR